ncbi:hypothetical protein [Streptomyces sp. CB00316]|uniref:hypothetical protein n=1 Tax=Streptomyces sp. CB00316 TaxID=1703932 RepID=UPI00093B0768
MEQAISRGSRSRPSTGTPVSDTGRSNQRCGRSFQILGVAVMYSRRIAGITSWSWTAAHAFPNEPLVR